MGRKLIRRTPSEKEADRQSSKGHIAIVVFQQVLIWSSTYVLASTGYLVHGEAITRDLIPSAAIQIFAVSTA